MVSLALLVILMFAGYRLRAQQLVMHGTDNEAFRKFRNITSVLDSQGMAKQYVYALRLAERNPDSARLLFADLVERNIYLQRYQNVAGAFLGIARCYSLEGKYDKSLFYSRKALQYAPFFRDKVKLAELYSNAAEPWYYKGDYDSTAFYIYKAAAVLRDTRITTSTDAAVAMRINARLGTLWNQLKRPENAFPFFRRADSLSAKFHDSSALVYINSGLGSSFMIIGEVDSALKYYQRSAILNKGRPNTAQVTLLASLGVLYLTQGEYEKSIANLRKAIALNEQFGDRIKAVVSSLTLGEAYYKMGNAVKAEEIWLSAFRDAEAIQYPDKGLQAQSASMLAKIYESRGDFKKAYIWQQKSTAWYDTLAARERSSLADELETTSLKVEKDNEIAKKQLLIMAKDGQIKEKNYMILFVSLVVIFLGILLFSFYRSNKHKQKLQAEQINALGQEQEIRQLRATLKGEENERARIARELHDGVASQLASVKLNLDHLGRRKDQKINGEEVENAFQQLEEATVELRKTAHNLMPDIIIDNGLQLALKLFCDKIQQASEIKVDFEVFGDIPRLHGDIELSIYRMIQELLQNVLKHAQATSVLVQLVYSDHLLSITIEDNGKGYNVRSIGNGAGLKNIEQRVSMLSGNMEVNSGSSSGTTIYLEFDIFQLLKHKTYVN